MAAPGVVVVAGGGSEGDIDEKTAWSYPLYKKLIDNGPTHGDGKIKVVVISLEKPDTNFMIDYLKSMGATSSENVVVDSREKANDPKIVDTVANADVIFFRGGNQAEAYRFWKNTRLHEHIKKVADRGGAIGGTSSGAMSLSEYAFAGGQDLVSKDVLQDSHSELLNDELGGTGIHNDFLGLVPGVIVDTHCGERGRVARLLGIHAKAQEDYKNNKIVGICLEERTGIAVSKGKVEVFGTGTAHFIQSTPDSTIIRTPGKPLVYTNVRDDALTEGWHYDLKKRSPDLVNIPKSALIITDKKDCGAMIHVEDAQNDDKIDNGDIKRGNLQTHAIKSLFDQPDTTIVMTPLEETITKSMKDQTIVVTKKNEKNIPDVATVIMDCSECTHKSLSSFVSNQDEGSNTLHSAGLINLKLHVLSNGGSFNLSTHKVKTSADVDSINSDLTTCQKYGDSQSLGPALSLLSAGKKIQRKLQCKE